MDEVQQQIHKIYHLLLVIQNGTRENLILLDKLIEKIAWV